MLLLLMWRVVVVLLEKANRSRSSAAELMRRAPMKTRAKAASLSMRAVVKLPIGGTKQNKTKNRKSD